MKQLPSWVELQAEWETLQVSLSEKSQLQDHLSRLRKLQRWDLAGILFLISQEALIYFDFFILSWTRENVFFCQTRISLN